jgi:hypothetical protein
MENNAGTPDRESRRTSSRIRGNDQSRNEIPILNKTIQNINNSRSKTPLAKTPRSKTPLSKTSNPQPVTAPRKRSVSTKKSKPKVEWRTFKINGPDVNKDPLLEQYCGWHVHYPVGKINGNDEVFGFYFLCLCFILIL